MRRGSLSVVSSAEVAGSSPAQAAQARRRVRASNPEQIPNRGPEIWRPGFFSPCSLSCALSLSLARLTETGTTCDAINWTKVYKRWNDPRGGRPFLDLTKRAVKKDRIRVSD